MTPQCGPDRNKWLQGLENHPIGISLMHKIPMRTTLHLIHSVNIMGNIKLNDCMQWYLFMDVMAKTKKEDDVGEANLFNPYAKTSIFGWNHFPQTA